MDNAFGSFRRGDVFIADLGERDLGENETHLQTGRRPVVIVQNDVGCFYSETVTMVPLTTSLKKLQQPTHYILKNAPFLKRQSMAIAEQVRTISKQQVLNFLGKLNQTDMDGVDQALKIQLGFDIPESIEAP